MCLYLASGLTPAQVAILTDVTPDYAKRLRMEQGKRIQAFYDNQDALADAIYREARLDLACYTAGLVKALTDNPDKPDARNLTLIAQALKNVDAIKAKATTKPQAKTPAKPTL